MACVCVSGCFLGVWCECVFICVCLCGIVCMWGGWVWGCAYFCGVCVLCSECTVAVFLCGWGVCALGVRVYFACLCVVYLCVWCCLCGLYVCVLCVCCVVCVFVLCRVFICVV